MIMDELEKDNLIKDINEFLDKPTQKQYVERGIPYQQGYLFFGPPGTGKSSFSLSITGQFKLDIYVVNLLGINNSSQAKLFAKLPLHYVILLEDINTVGFVQTDNISVALKKEENQKSRATLSGLLNILDGVGS